ncbi:MAG: glycosyltransferase, partial [Planctomycetia bacterium]
RQQAARLRRQLKKLRDSSTWAMAERLRVLAERVAPPSSRFGRAVRLGMRGCGLLRREGLPGVYRRVVKGKKPPTPTVAAAPKPTAPAPTPRPAPSAATLASKHYDPQYYEWIQNNEPFGAALDEQRLSATALPYRPLLSILTPAFNTPPHVFQALVDSLKQQTYSNWELKLVDGGSTDRAAVKGFKEAAEGDTRVHLLPLESNRGISGNTNVGLQAASGEFVVLVDHDDVLPPWALYEVVARLNAEPDLDFLYSDKDMISEDGSTRFGPLFKPQLSLPTLLAANYLTHLSTTRTELARRIGGFREETDGAQDWDFFLRILENSRRVAHIPKILYHWRLWERSVSSGHAAKPYVFEAQKRTLEDHFQRHAGLKVEAEVEVGKQVVYRFKEAAKRSVSVVVQAGRLHENFTALLKTLLAERERLPEGNLEILVAHGGDATAGWRSFYRTLEQDLGVKVVCDAAFPTSWSCRNEAARRATGDAVLFLDEELTPVAAGWLDEMRQWLAYPGVAAVSGCVTGPDGTIERGGWSVGGSELCRPIFGGLPFERWTTFGNSDWMRSHSAFSGDALMVDRQAFLAAGGFDESYGSWGADFDLCLKLHETGATLL